MGQRSIITLCISCVMLSNSSKNAIIKCFGVVNMVKNRKCHNYYPFFYFDGSSVLVIQINSFIREYDEKGNDEEECH